MARLPPRVRNFCSILLFLSSLTNFVFAQLSQDACAGRLAVGYSDLYDGIQRNPSNDTMKWCPWWAAACSYVYRNCRPAVSCEFTNYDPKITTRYDPSLPSSLYYFQNCSSCNVRGWCVGIFLKETTISHLDTQLLSIHTNFLLVLVSRRRTPPLPQVICSLPASLPRI